MNQIDNPPSHECIESYVVCYDSGGIFPHTVNCGRCGKPMRLATNALPSAPQQDGRLEPSMDEPYVATR